MMFSARIQIGKTLALVVVSLLLCGIVAAEFPELLSLTDNTANDFTVRNPNTVAKRDLSHANRHARIADTDLNSSVSGELLSTVTLAKAAASLFADLLALHPVLRT